MLFLLRGRQEAKFEEIDAASFMEDDFLAGRLVLDVAAAISNEKRIPSFDGLPHRGDRHGNFHVIEWDGVQVTAGQINVSVDRH